MNHIKCSKHCAPLMYVKGQNISPDVLDSALLDTLDMFIIMKEYVIRCNSMVILCVFNSFCTTVEFDGIDQVTLIIHSRIRKMSTL